MADDASMRRAMIELRRTDGPISGRFMIDGATEPQQFASWFELLALLEAARRPDQATVVEREGDL